MGTIERIDFTKKEYYEKQQDGVSYKLDPTANILYTTYEEDIRYKKHVKSIAPSIINEFGEKKVNILGDVLNTFGILSIAFGFPMWIPLLLSEKITILEKYISKIIISLFILALIFAWVGYEFIESVSYFKDSKCKKCGKDFACNEFKKPKVEEISSPDLYEITLTRYWKCKYCRDTDPRTESVEFTHKKGSLDKLSTQTCSVCKKENALEIQKNPDIKVEVSKTTTIRHYMCKYCNSCGIEIETEIDDYD